MLNDHLSVASLISVAAANFWALVISLGSGTTGGVFAPSLVVGGGLGSAYSTACQHFFPRLLSDPAFYSLVAMAAVFGDIARVPFTSIVFLCELSHNPNSILPLVVSVMIADGFVRLCSRDSIMTIKLVKRGLIISQDYSVLVLMRASIDQVMKREFNIVHIDETLQSVIEKYKPSEIGFIPVVNVVGVVRANDILQLRRWLLEEETGDLRRTLSINACAASSSRIANPVVNCVLSMRSRNGQKQGSQCPCPSSGLSQFP